MKKLWMGILLGVLVILGLTVFVQRKKIFNLTEDDYDDECCGEDCCCDCTEEPKEEEPKKEVENTIA